MFYSWHYHVNGNPAPRKFTSVELLQHLKRNHFICNLLSLVPEKHLFFFFSLKQQKAYPQTYFSRWNGVETRRLVWSSGLRSTGMLVRSVESWVPPGTTESFITCTFGVQGSSCAEQNIDLGVRKFDSSFNLATVILLSSPKSWGLLFSRVRREIPFGLICHDRIILEHVVTHFVLVLRDKLKGGD